MHTILLIVANLAVISALLWFFDVPYRQYRIDLLRDQLFGARDSLFAAARDGAISFSNPACEMTRQIINGMIQLSDQVGLWQLLLMQMTRRFWEVPQERAKFSRRLANARSALTSNERKVVDDVLDNAHKHLLSHVAHTSLCLFPFAFAAEAFGVLPLSKSDRSVSKRVLDWLDGQAYVIGKLRVLTEVA